MLYQIYGKVINEIKKTTTPARFFHIASNVEFYGSDEGFLKFKKVKKSKKFGSYFLGGFSRKQRIMERRSYCDRRFFLQL